jgi:hypothetical protein
MNNWFASYQKLNFIVLYFWNLEPSVMVMVMFASRSVLQFVLMWFGNKTETSEHVMFFTFVVEGPVFHARGTLAARVLPPPGCAIEWGSSSLQLRVSRWDNSDTLNLHVHVCTGAFPPLHVVCSEQRYHLISPFRCQCIIDHWFGIV